MRKYIGFWDDGHDYGEFYYYSKYRNYSKKNMEDMKSSYLRQYGKSAYRGVINFSFGYLIKEG